MKFRDLCLFSTLRASRLGVSLLCSLFVCQNMATAAETDLPKPSAEQAAYFEQHVRPLLVKHCYECHSADSKILQGGLLLDSRPGWQKGGDSGAAIVPGKPDESLLVRAVRYDKNEFVHMPPKGKLGDAEIATLTEWVRLGAPDPRTTAAVAVAKRTIDIEAGKKHWSFLPLQNVTPPSVADEAVCRNPIDRFIQAKLQAAKVKGNPEADPRTLLRRAYFDLVGLPPSPEEADLFVELYFSGPRRGGSGLATDTAEDFARRQQDATYDALLDKLLASPHYGERWGRHWLDLARYGESHGFEQDYDRPYAYHYRDFVIDALNRDLPYDTFVKWQLAGDEYEPTNPQALKATGFLAAGVHATQITANQAEKERYDELDDMARTVGTTFLGLTVGCARCHDHKYDPITNADYYRIAATFTTTVRSDFDVPLDPVGDRAALAKFEATHQPLVAALQAYERETIGPKFATWLQQRPLKLDEPEWITLVPTKVSGPATVKFETDADGTVRTRGTQFIATSYTFEATTKLAGITAVRLEALADPALPQNGPGTAADGSFNLTQLKVTVAPSPEKGAKPKTPAPVAVEVPIARMTATHDDSKPTGTEERRRPNTWGVKSQLGRDHAAVFEFKQPIGETTSDEEKSATKLTLTLTFGGNYQGLGRFRIAVCTEPKSPPLDGPAMTEAALQAWRALQQDPAHKLTAPERAALLGWFRAQDAEWRKRNALVTASESLRPQPKSEKMLISGEGIPAVRLHTQGPDFYDKTFVLRRGDPNQKVEEAQAGFLQVLVRSDDDKRWRAAPPADVKTTYRRRALAEWMTDVEHGAGHLLARVIVNRLWKQHLGQGLVANPSDFGSQAERPVHAELLDYLANELIRHDWRLKPIHKLIMQSAVYRQTTTADAARRKLDPDNRLFWHRELRRLEGEVIRDAMLSLSGTLDETMFGPGTMDEKHRRRSIYFFFKRSKLPKMLALFDGPDTLQDLAVRGETTVAPQALWLMNNEIVRDYATDLAKQVMPASPGDVEAGVESGVTLAYRKVFARPPTSDELRDSTEFVRAQVAAYRAAGKQQEAEASAWTDFCQVLFGLNEFAYVE